MRVDFVTVDRVEVDFVGIDLVRRTGSLVKYCVADQKTLPLQIICLVLLLCVSCCHCTYNYVQ